MKVEYPLQCKVSSTDHSLFPVRLISRLSCISLDPDNMAISEIPFFTTACFMKRLDFQENRWYSHSEMIYERQVSICRCSFYPCHIS